MDVLVTGAASGIGRSVVDIFLENNHNVFAVDVNNVEPRDNLKSFLGDVTDKESLNRVYDYLVDNNIKLDLIVNVAGIHKMSSFIESDYEKMKKVIEVNLMGTMLVNRTFHRLLKEKGKVVIVTSEVAGLAPLPFNGLYSVSKSALDCYAQALRQELNLLKQKVITIRPGAVLTPLSSGSLDDTKQLVSDTVIFKKQSKKFYDIVKKFMGKPIEPERVGKLIYKVSNKRYPKYIYNIHRNPGLVILGKLPLRLQCFIVKVLVN